MKILRVALYARVSTKMQDASMQLEELREYASRRGDLEIVGEFVDILTGSKDSRPALNEVMMLARQRKIDAILVWKLDRWGRSLQHLIGSIHETEPTRRAVHQLSRQCRPDHSQWTACLPFWQSMSAS